MNQAAVNRVAPQDAIMFWLSRRSRNDLFLLYSFADRGRPTAELRAALLTRARRIPDLAVRLREVPGDLNYPAWVPCAVLDSQIVEHRGVADWPGLESAVGELLGTGVDAAERPWRVHLFRGVGGAPGPAPDGETATVVVLQISHALADGRRAAAIARELFGAGEDAAAGARWREGHPGAAQADRPGASGGAASSPAAPAPWAGDVVPAVLGALLLPVHIVRTVFRGYRAFRAQRALAESTAAGAVPPPTPGFAPNPLNPAAVPTAHAVRMLVFAAAELRVPGRTVTVVVLTAVSVALSEYLAAQGHPVERLGAQVPMGSARNGKRLPRNNYRNLSIDLAVDEPELSARADRIAAALRAGRERAGHPLTSAQDLVTAVTPAVFLHRDVRRWPLDLVPDSIAGHTVVSSVDRGPADLHFGGPVRFTAGFPAIGSVMHLTHGVHGLGETVTVSIHADPAAVGDLDGYAAHLRAAVTEVVAALR
ncbi:hypothetical protein IU436_24785 [Nocardia farcinica]|uniref:wax ester/triacylglycerol synthase domain-containing protein n=1 Tax=Nocardia farcinica TaxID=37329 RepID=UPI000BF66289|nr:wax ester/triacylglycerol synthase domain-containing protein [Nocardia farcinica]MBF6421908.1 hypothetical protein [Nocardia farcinica]MBF6433565.1 hypothetical protein [Nocardia farcinica]MBF6504308.1 hypothetical protein [Nocardia farcinica]